MSIKFLVLGGVFWVLGGGGSADFIFMGARIFLNLKRIGLWKLSVRPLEQLFQKGGTCQNL